MGHIIILAKLLYYESSYLSILIKNLNNNYLKLFKSIAIDLLILEQM